MIVMRGGVLGLWGEVEGLSVGVEGLSVGVGELCEERRRLVRSWSHGLVKGLWLSEGVRLLHKVMSESPVSPGLKPISVYVCHCC